MSLPKLGIPLREKISSAIKISLTRPSGIAEAANTGRIMALLLDGTFLDGTLDSDVLIGRTDGLNHYLIGEAGNDLLIGELNAFWDGTLFAPNNSTATATDINLAANWSIGENSLIDDSLIPHTTIYSEGTGAEQFFTFNAGPGSDVTIDIDFANFDSQIEILDESLTVVASNNDGGTLDTGSVLTTDSFVQFTAALGGAYVIRVFETDAGSGETDIEAGESFMLNVSVDGHAATAVETQGSDRIEGGDGADILVGNGGDDELYGGNGVDHLYGGTGDDVLHGGDGADVYHYYAGDGADIIEDNGIFDIDRIIFHGFDQADATFTQVRGGSDLLIDFGGGDSVLVRNTLNGDGGDQVEQYTFEDVDLNVGTIFDLLILGASTAGDDIITGSAFSNTISGGLGDDYLSGRDGSDIYQYAAGDGADIIDDNGIFDTDVLTITGYNSTDASFSRLPFSNNLLIDFGGGDSILIINGAIDDGGDRIETIGFDDGSFTAAEIRQLAYAELVTTGSDVIIGSNATDTGLTGGAGADFVEGGDASDTYIYNAGDGADVFADFGAFDNDQVTVNGYSSTDVTYRLNDAYPNDLILDFGGGDVLTLRNIYANSGIEGLTFAGDAVSFTRAQLQTEGTTSGISVPIVLGTTASETIDATTADEILRGGDGADTYTYQAGDGADIIDDNGFFDTDVLEITGYDLADATFERVNGYSEDVLIRFTATDSILLRNGFNDTNGDNIEQITFLNLAETITTTDIRATIIAQETSAGDDIIEAFYDDNIIEGGLGDDILSGRDGNDTYIFSSGDGNDIIHDRGFFDTDVLQFTDYDSTDASFSRGVQDRTDLIITFLSGDSVTIRNTLGGANANQIEQIQFLGDSVTYNLLDILDILNQQQVTSGDDIIIGSGNRPVAIAV